MFEAGAHFDLSTMTTYGGNRSPGSAFERFEQEYQAKFGSPPESLQTALGYDLVMVVAAAVEKAGSFEGPGRARCPP